MFSYYELEQERRRTDRERNRAEAERYRADQAMARSSRAEEDAANVALGGIILGTLISAPLAGVVGYMLGKK